MSKRDYFLLLTDMLEAANRILSYTDGMSFEDFESDQKTVDAVIRNFEVIGEAANNFNEEYRKSNPRIQWDRIRGYRNRLIHEYFGVDLEIIWNIIEDDINDLIAQLENLNPGK
jgi:uncharacterized protein with HEPN domain